MTECPHVRQPRRVEGCEAERALALPAGQIRSTSETHPAGGSPGMSGMMWKRPQPPQERAEGEHPDRPNRGSPVSDKHARLRWARRISFRRRPPN